MRMLLQLQALFKFSAGHHNLMPAFCAFYSEIGADTQYFPLIAAARMAFFSCYNLSYRVFCHLLYLSEHAADSFS